MRSLLDWLDNRTGYRGILQAALYEPIPGGARWRYVWGSTLTFVFFLQVITGFCLWSAYSPSALSAWESVYYIQHEMTFGWFIRGIHHYAAQAMVVLLALHFFQVVIDGAYRAPREINFWVGLIMMKVVLGLALTGYLLPWDQKGYYATQVATNIVGVTPVIGPYLQQLVQGGTNYGHLTLTRFFTLHAGILPTLLTTLLIIHLYVFRRHGITVPKSSRDQTPAPFWPDQVLRDAIACLAVFAVILFLTLYRGAELAGPADPSEAFSSPRPEWYFLFLFRFLKFEWVDKLGLEFGAIYVPGGIFFVIFMMPFIGRWQLGHRFNVAFTLGLLIAAIYLTGLAIYEDHHDKDLQAAMREAERDGKRAVQLAQQHGIPAEGILSLLKQDPLTQGPRLFARKCASCHRYDGHDGTGRLVTRLDTTGDHPRLVEEPPTAADLGDFGTRDWIKRVLLTYHEVFSPLNNLSAPADDDAKKQAILSGEMAQWSEENRGVLQSPENEADLRAILEFFAQQSARQDLAPIDQSLAERGAQIVQTGKLTQGALSSACVDCHALKLRGAGGAVSENSGSGAPTLSSYGGAEWLKQFLKDPAHPDFYGEKNLMPAFGASLSDKELNLLVDWLTHNYLPMEQ